ncbi:MAG: serine hydrolase [Methanosarcinales archaeon]|nr:serine hydrolase [Methanosarcinales archaeon]
MIEIISRYRKILILIVPVVVLILLIFVLVPQLHGPEQVSTPTYWPTHGWHNSTPEEHGFDSAKLAEALLAMREQNINIHSLLIIQDGEVLLDAYFYPYDGTTVHDQASVTKSVMTTLIAIADEEGKLQLDQPMVSYFPERTIQNNDVRKQNITVRHLASMSSGLDCTSERDEATLNEMMASPDWIQFTLDRKVVWEPGTHFVYCSPGMHLLSAILQNATGMTALEYARLNLFEPLGIHDVIWYTDPKGYNTGSADLYLHPYDMAKIGYLWLNKGQWEGKQIVSSEWVENSVKVQMVTGGNDDYGYGWWVPKDEPVAYSAFGRGGQRILVVPDWDLIVVTTGGGFDFDEIEPLLIPAIVDMGHELPANPAGMVHLEAALDTIKQPPAPLPVAPLPEMAREISGKSFTFDPNPLGVEKMRLEFNDSDEAIIYLMLTEEGEMPPWPIGLDGVYRLSPGDNGLTLGLRGYWADEHTFVLEYDEIANNGHIILWMRFEGDRVVMEGQEAAHELELRFEGVQGKT